MRISSEKKNIGKIRISMIMEKKLSSFCKKLNKKNIKIRSVIINRWIDRPKSSKKHKKKSKNKYNNKRKDNI
jgi:hypothetical protein